MHRLVLAVSVAAVLTPSLARAQAPGDTAGFYRESYGSEARGEYAAALQALEEVGARGAADYVFHLRRGWLLHLLTRHADALAAYQKAVALEPEAVEPRLGATLPAMALRRWGEVERLCTEALARAPGDSVALGRLAWAQYQQGRWEKAAASYRRALALAPANVEMRAGLGWSLLKLGRADEAKAEFLRVLAVAPDHASAREGRAQVP